ncbi:MAG TPA: alpha-amylase family glycosyl hydrolase [Gemmatimonadaceae bacterium]|nr:alpha-amylase family glycosyl hydrolase [Gemmatimonadaceae bacterium]
MRRFAAGLCVGFCLVACSSVGAQPSASSTISGWKRGAVCYEVFVRSFYDSDGDGIGDLNGLTQKLDYINNGDSTSQRDLGARCIWLMPVVASPSYHGYDATNYYRVNPQYGSNDDFKRFIAAAHRRGIHVLVDMVLNHVSNEHPMFKDALLNPSSPYRDWFRWSATDPKTKGPWGQEVWHRSPIRNEYYYGIFWEGMPDLNYMNPAVRDEAKKIARFWLQEMGVDGFRLDAVPYLVEEGDQLAGTPGTHAELREYASYVRQIAPRSFTVGEVWDSVGAMLPYYPDQLDSYFAFELSDAVIDAVRNGSATKLLGGYMRLQAALPADRWSPFLRNHDQTRTLTALGGDIQRARMAATLLLTLPGFPFVYYGEEVGMTGDKPDPRLRTPMHWSRGAAAGFTRGLPWEPLQHDSLTANVAAQDRDANSLLNLYRRLIHLRSAQSALAVGELVPLDASSEAVAAYVRRDGRHAVLVVANLGTGTLNGITVASSANALPAGQYTLRSLLGGGTASPLRVGSDGRIAGYVPVPMLAPMTSYVFDLAR